MTIRASCPKCDAPLEPDGLEAVPPFCPFCGGRIACPRCGRLLQGDPAQPSHFRCPECHLTLVGEETVPDGKTAEDSPAISVQIPGFELRGMLGRGGMGIVYRAWQRNLQREVAIKVLPPALAADPSRLERFRHEAAVAAGLIESHILPIHDVQEVDGVPVLVMPLIEGADLAKVIRDRSALRNGQAPSRPHPWAVLDDRAYLDHILPLLDQMVDAVTVIHQAGVLHRDLKPSNALVDSHGNLWLTDFGLARLELKGAGTSPGQVMGTPGFMAPEQARGLEDIDFRADLFSLGATLYKALTLEMPYGERGEKGDRNAPVPPSKHQPLLSPDFDAVLLKALEWDRDLRYPSAKEFQEDWQRVRQGLLPKARRIGRPRRLLRWTRRHPKEVIGILMIVLLLAIAGFALTRETNPPPADPPDPTVYRLVNLTTEPEGARVSFVPLNKETGFPDPNEAIYPENKTPLTNQRLPVGEYLVTAKWPDRRFHEVFRVVPPPNEIRQGYTYGIGLEKTDGSVDLPKILTPPTNDVLHEDMVKFPGGPFVMGTKNLRSLTPHLKNLDVFYLDITEVTVKKYRENKELPEKLKKNSPPDDSFPITMVTFDQALEYAEMVGKRLPDEAEYEYAATNGGMDEFPWGNDATMIVEWPLGPVGHPSFDRTKTKTEVFGLYSNVLEWTLSRPFPYPGASRPAIESYLSMRIDARVVRGGPSDLENGKPPLDLAILRQGPRQRPSILHNRANPGVGFRCAVSAEPRFLRD